MKFTKKPVTIDAVQIPQEIPQEEYEGTMEAFGVYATLFQHPTGLIQEAKVETGQLIFVVEDYYTYYKVIHVLVGAPGGVVKALPGEWVITGVEGERYPCSDTIFRASYEKAIVLPSYRNISQEEIAAILDANHIAGLAIDLRAKQIEKYGATPKSDFEKYSDIPSDEFNDLEESMYYILLDDDGFNAGIRDAGLRDKISKVLTKPRKEQMLHIIALAVANYQLIEYGETKATTK